MSEETDFYEKLKKSLDETTTFPAPYLFKFIIPTDNSKFKEIENIFNNFGAVITSKPSSGGKYTSLSINMEIESSDEIIKKYMEVSKVEGVISL